MWCDVIKRERLGEVAQQCLMEDVKETPCFSGLHCVTPWQGALSSSLVNASLFHPT